jgi:hypothetical protein
VEELVRSHCTVLCFELIKDVQKFPAMRCVALTDAKARTKYCCYMGKLTLAIAQPTHGRYILTCWLRFGDTF